MRNSIRLAILPVLIGVLTAPTAGRVVCTAWSPDGETIAFTSDRDGDGELFELNLETGEVRQLTFNDCPDEHPTWSPSGERTVFSSSRGGSWYDLYALTLKNGSTTRLTSDEGYYNPCFSGDGKLIFYDSGLDGGCLGAVNLETGDINRDLTWDTAGEPTWGPSE